MNHKEDKWYEANREKLQEEFIKDHPEDFPTDESYSEIEQNDSFNDWVDEQFKKVGVRQ